jgi:hypothetical protein
MNKASQTNTLRENAPKVFAVLARYLADPHLDQLAAEYFECVELGGNEEPGMVREEGVSFNPRMARVLSLLLTDGGVRDLDTLRVSLYAASPRAVQDSAHLAPTELRELVVAVWTDPCAMLTAALIRGAIELDAVRHLHQTTYSVAEREEILAHTERTVLADPLSMLPEWLRKKLEHAITLQRRQIDLP